MTEDELFLKIKEGEGYLVEFKEKISDGLAREIVAFANASGGEIYLGVKDNGQIVGIEITNKLLSQAHSIARDCDPSIQITLKKYEAQQVLVILVEEGIDKPYRCADGFFLRIGPNAQKLKRDEIVKLINDSGKIHFDEAVNQRFIYPEDFEQELLENYLKQCDVSLNFPTEDILLSLNIVQKSPELLRFTNAAVLFFAKKPQNFFPEAYITAVLYRSNDRYDILDKKDFSGSPISQIEESLAFVIRHMSAAADFSKISGGARQDIYDYPIIAIREAIINAVVHRDYLYDGAHIYIHMYPDHIDIENPGGLYHGITLDDLGRRSVRRNPLIADLLHRARYIERVGSGFDRMRRSLAENQNPPLEVTATNFFNIRFYKRAQNADLSRLSPRQLMIYQLFRERSLLTKREIALILKISEDSAVRDLKVLLEQGLIQRQGVGKATVYVVN